jgi:hypothetical protein
MQQNWAFLALSKRLGRVNSRGPERGKERCLHRRDGQKSGGQRKRLQIGGRNLVQQARAKARHAVVLYTALTLIPSASEDRRALAAARASSPA